MERQSVSSSNIRSVGHDTESRLLEVEFTSGSVYQYAGVTDSVYAALLRAASKGQYLNANIKDRYSCRKVR
jgi:hypothetical protein